MSVLSPLERAKIGIEGFAEKHRMKRCWLFHDWQVWGVVTRGRIISEGIVIGKYVYLERVCARCGNHRVKIVKDTI